MNKKIIVILAVLVLVLVGGFFIFRKDNKVNSGNKNEFIYSGDFGVKIENIKKENNVINFDVTYKVPEKSLENKKINIDTAMIDSTILFVTEEKIFEAAHSMGFTVKKDSYLNVVAKDNFGKNYRKKVMEVNSTKVSSKKIDKDTYTASYSCKLNEDVDIANAKIMVSGFEILDREYGKYQSKEYILDEYINLEFMFK